MIRRVSIAVAVLAGLLVGATPASARKTAEVVYDYGQIWAAAVRLVRVDYGFVLRDRDEEVGFLLFDYVDRGRTHAGSIELVRTGEGARSRVRIVVQVPTMPSYVEQMMLERLQRKLRDDFGMPVVRPTASRPAAAAETPETPPAEPDAEGEAESD